MKKEKNNSHLLEWILLGCIALAFAAAAWILLPNWYSDYRDRQSRKELQALFPSPPVAAAAPTSPKPQLSPTAPEAPTVDPALQEAMLALHQQNPDFAGWLKGGSNLDYPVMLRDDSYYLNRDFFCASDPNGTLFLNGANSIRPRDDVLIIHGHAMNSGAMFGRLSEFSRESQVKAHPLFSFQTIYDAAPVYYTPFAAFHASMMPEQSDYYHLVQPSFPAKENGQRPEYQAYLEDIQNRSILNLPVDVDIDDQLLVLVTCSYYNNDGRFMLFCRRLRPEESPDRITALYESWNPSK